MVSEHTTAQIESLVGPSIPFIIYVCTDCSDSEALIRLLAGLRWIPEGTQILSLPVPQYSKAGLAALVASHTVESVHLGGEPTRTVVILGNAAPRDAGAENCVGCDFCVVPLPGRTLYLGTFGSELSPVRELISDGALLEVDIPKNGTQYRSRFLGRALERIFKRDHTVYTKTVSPDSIPVIPKKTLLWDDCFGNQKLNLTLRDMGEAGIHFGARVDITINGVPLKGIRYAEHLADGESGEVILYPGSTCHDVTDSTNRLVEIGKVLDLGGKNPDSAAHQFVSPQGLRVRHGLPLPGTAVLIEKAA